MTKCFTTYLLHFINTLKGLPNQGGLWVGVGSNSENCSYWLRKMNPRDVRSQDFSESEGFNGS